MPFRKKSNLSYVSRAARKLRQLRLKEMRLDAQHERDRRSRIQFEPWEASEGGQQGDERLSSGQEARIEVLSETLREARLAKDRARHAYVRMWESEAQREKRLTESRERSARMRKNESMFQRAIRLARDRERHARLRARDRERHAFMTETMADHMREAYVVCSDRYVFNSPFVFLTLYKIYGIVSAH